MPAWRGRREVCYRDRDVESPEEWFDGEFDSPEQREAVRRARWRRELGMAPPERRPDSEAPPVDESLILGLIDQTLPEETARTVFRYTHVYPSWGQAETRLRLQRYLASREPPVGESDDA